MLVSLQLESVLASMFELTPITISAGFFISIFAAGLGFFFQSRMHHRDSALSPWGKVQTSIYRHSDLWGVVIIWVFFSALIITSLVLDTAVKPNIRGSDLLMPMLMQFMFAGIAIAWMRSRLALSDWLGLRWEKWASMIWIGPAAVITMWICMSVLYFSGFTPWLQSLGFDPVQDTVKLMQETQDPSVLIMMSLLAVMVAPLCEEVVFRGFVYPVLKSSCGWKAAMLASALFFSCAHGSVITMVPLCVFGCLLVWIYEKTGSIWAPIAVHACFNGATVAIQLIARFSGIPIDSP